ncbi:hypothetical protein N180_01260 [Pedobacter antarcticus 4BY]|uniref:Lipoprotein n=2 Tax=Pedobacter antarcticus TaxID=34086 RepID=A0A081PC68_9SPHI|nr:hypothetical protein [Pedobacter antarcticus]KEQ28291.1 hypothetical protein N180_01260 [Pedobacter antarcticus 4BY]SFE47895.1 hypothetical protein SAMN03003324_00618 [Pedobacter antarcticus]
MKINHALLFVVLLIIQSCSAFSDNKVNITKAEIERQIMDQAKGNLQLLSFEKTNGKEVQNEDYQYEQEFKAKVLVKNDCMWLVGSPTLAIYSHPFHTSEYQENSFDGVDINGNRVKSISNVKAGENIDFNGVAYLEKTENGWQVLKVELEPKQQ